MSLEQPSTRALFVLMILGGLLAVLTPGIPSAHGGNLPPNELGKFLILEYHKIDVPEARWTRTPDHFREDLQRLWEHGFRLTRLDDLLDGKVTVPAGTTPVVLTFDDSSPGQFRYLEQKGGLVIDPNCAVGILEAFERQHPEFGHAATFYVLPGANPPNRLFNQPALVARKLQYLVSHGYEVGNHTLWHADLAKYPEATVREQVAMAQVWIARDLPNFRFRTLALPLGDYPRDLRWLTSGSAAGTTYRIDGIMRVVGGPAPSPFAAAWDPYHLPRIQGVDGAVTQWTTYYDRHPDERFVSDGKAETITVPRGRGSEVRAQYAARAVERQ